VKKEIALVIVEAWKKNSKVMEVQELKDYFAEKNQFVPYKASIKVMVSERNRLASSALWDGHFNRAVVLLMKHGLKDSSQVRKPELNETYIVSNRLSGDIRNPKSDWKYVK
jgi:hypothetical protein